MATAKEIWRIPDDDKSGDIVVRSLTLPDGKELFLIHGDLCWTPSLAKSCAEPPSLPHPEAKMVLAPDGKTAAVITHHDGELRLVDVKTGSPVNRVEGQLRRP